MSPASLPASTAASSSAPSRLAPNATSIARAYLQLIVTEHGVADLRTADIDTRAKALIAIADPVFRDTLAEEWDQIRSAM